MMELEVEDDWTDQICRVELADSTAEVDSAVTADFVAADSAAQDSPSTVSILEAARTNSIVVARDGMQAAAIATAAADDEYVAY